MIAHMRKLPININRIVPAMNENYAIDAWKYSGKRNVLLSYTPYALNCKIAAKAQLLKIDTIDQDFG